MKLNYKRTILTGLAFLSICAFWQFYDNEIPKILKNTFHLGETWTGVLMSLDNILALFLLPLFGSLSDKVNTKIGKRMPFILGGTACAVILLMVLTTLTRQPNMLKSFVFVLLLLLVAMGTYRSPAVSLMPDLTPHELRSKANAIINLMGTIGGIMTLLLIRFLVKAPEPGQFMNYWLLTISVALIMVVSVVILFFTIKENKMRVDVIEEKGEVSKGMEMTPEVKRSLVFLLFSVFFWFTAYNAVTTAFSRYAGVVWGLQDGSYASALMVANVGAIVSYLPIGQISQKIGRKKMILIGVIVMAVCFLAASFVVEYQVWFNALFALVGFGWAAINVNSYPMVVEMSGAADIGKYTGMYYTFSMAAQVVTPILSGALLQFVSYRTLFPYAVIFCVIAFFTMRQVKHGDVVHDPNIYEQVD